MFTANLPTQNYRLVAIFYALETAIIGATAPDQGCLFNSYSQTTYGNAYNAGVHGFKVTFTTQRIPGGASSYSIDFESPWWSGNIANSATLILNNATVTVEIDDVDHACGCDAWALSFSELRIYLDGVLNHTITAQSDSGTSYDPRDDDTEEYNESSPYIGIAWGRPNCGGWANRITNAYQTNLQSHLDGIWERSPVASPGWVEDGISVAGYTAGGLGCLSCGTAVTGPTNLVGGTTTVSKHVRIQTWYQDALIAADLTDIECECLPSHTVNGEWHYWTMQRQLDWLPPITAKFIPTASPIRKHTWREQESCLSSAGNSSYDSGVVTVTDANGVSIWNGSRFKGDWLRYCVEQFYGPVPCLIGETRSCTPFDPTVPANIPPDVYCYFTITVVMTWPEKPPCTDAKYVWNAVFRFDPQLGVSWINSSGEPRWYGSDFSVPGVGQVWARNTSMGSGLTDAISVSFGRDIRTWRLYAIVERAGSLLYSTYSDDEGATWASLTSLGSGSMPFIWGDNFGLIQCWMDTSVSPAVAKGQYRHPGDTAWSATFTFKDSASADIQLADGGMSNVCPANDMQDRLLWSPILFGDTTPTTHFSADYGRTWQPL